VIMHKNGACALFIYHLSALVTQVLEKSSGDICSSEKVVLKVMIGILFYKIVLGNFWADWSQFFL